MSGRRPRDKLGVLTTRWRQSSDQSFVEAAFAGLLKRSPDASGRAHYVDKLRGGSSRSEVLNTVFESPEAARHLVYSPGLRGLVEEFWMLRQRADPSVRPLCFLHIMKTGGTSLAEALAEMAGSWPRLGELFCDHIVCLPRPLLAQAMLVVGHLPYEAVELLPADIAVCTVLRDPVERTLSHHAHVATERLAGGGQRSPLSLEEFLCADLWRPLWENYQARQLAHRIGLGDAWMTFSPRQQGGGRELSAADADYPLQSLFDSAPLSMSSADLAPAALAALDQIDIVGVTEDLPGVVSDVAALWRTAVPATFSHLRVSEERVDRDRVPPALLSLIEEGTEVDQALHARARARASASSG